MRNIFDGIYRDRLWANTGESLSGEGSENRATENIRRSLPDILRDLKTRKLLDCGCGDLFWISKLELPCEYQGVDVSEIVLERARMARPGVNVGFLDICVGPLPECDTVLCRDCLMHLSNSDLDRALAVICGGGANYLLATTFDNTGADIQTGQYREINLEHKLGRALNKFLDNDKWLGLWDLHDLRFELQHKISPRPLRRHR